MFSISEEIPINRLVKFFWPGKSFGQKQRREMSAAGA